MASQFEFPQPASACQEAQADLTPARQRAQALRPLLALWRRSALQPLVRRAAPGPLHATGAADDRDALLQRMQQENQVLRLTNRGLIRALADAARQSAEAHRLAHEDALTGLPNRLQLLARLRPAIEEARLRGTQLALLFVDLNGFKAVNDLHGHGVGDRVLAIAAARILAGVRSQDTACRYGGDEFVLLLSDVGSRAAALAVAADIRRRVSQRYRVDEIQGQLSASVGLAMYPADGLTSQALLRSADDSMYRNKANRHLEAPDDGRAATRGG